MKTLALIATLSLALFLACRSETASVLKNEIEHESEPAAEVEAELYQRTVYNGKPQPITFTYSGDEALLRISYFDSFKSFEKGEGGKTAAPVESGHYFVLIEQLAGSAAAGNSLIVEYLIEPKELRIIAESRQTAVYDGNPKRVVAEADMSAPLSYSYFPSIEAMRAVMGSAETPQEQRQTAVPRGLTRVERPPIEPGTYYVLVYYSGSRNYRSVSKEIEFTIRPRY